MNELTLFSLALASSSPEGARNDGVAGTVKPRPRSAPNAGLPSVPLVPAVPLSPFGPCRPLGSCPDLKSRASSDRFLMSLVVSDEFRTSAPVSDEFLTFLPVTQRGVLRAAECDEQRDEGW